MTLLEVLMMIGFGLLMYWLGFTASKTKKTDPPVTKVRSVKMKYQAGNLLDPITPKDQRLDHLLSERGEIRGEEDSSD